MSRLDYRRKRQRELAPEPEKANPQKRWSGLIVLALLVLVIALVVVLAAQQQGFWDSIVKNDGQELTIDQNTLATIPYSTDQKGVSAVYGNDVVIADVSGVRALSPAGEVKWEVELAFNTPFISVDGSYVLAADKGGKDVYIINNGKLELHSKTQYPILNARVMSDGNFVTITDEPYYKGLVSVRNIRDEEQFVWHSGSVYVIDAALSQNAQRLAVAVIDAQVAIDEESEGSFTSGVMMFNLYESEPYQTHYFHNGLVTNVYKNGVDAFIALADSFVAGFGQTGEIVWSYDYPGAKMHHVAHADSLTAVCMTDADGMQKIVVIDSQGKEKCVIPVETEVRFLSLCADRLAFNRASGIAMYNTDGRELYTISNEFEYSAFKLFDGGRRGLGTTTIAINVIETR